MTFQRDLLTHLASKFIIVGCSDLCVVVQSCGKIVTHIYCNECGLDNGEIRPFNYNSVYNILIMKVNEMQYFSDLLDKVLDMFQTGPLSIIRSISTLYTRKRYLSF